MKSFIVYLLLMLALASGVPLFSRTAPEGCTVPDPVDSLTLALALSRVLERSPELAASELEVQAAAARIMQAGLKPNPEILAETENFAAFGGNGLFRRTESTLQWSQRVELGGKRLRRILAAESEQGVAGQELELNRYDLRAAITLAFAEVLAAQQRLLNQRELYRLAQQAHSIVSERVAAGKISPVEQTRAAVTLADTRVEEEKLAQALVAAKDNLAAMWGGSRADFERAEGKFDIDIAPAGLTDACMDRNPALRLADAILESRRATLALEQSARKPDLTVSAGFRYLNEDSAGAWVAGVSIPLPLFDKRQGAIAEARIRLDKSLWEKRALERRLLAGLTRARHEHTAALQEMQSLAQTALPAAREAAAALEEGFRLGKFDYLNVLDAQRTFAELQRRHIEAIAAGMKAGIEIERLAGCESPAGSANPTGESKEASREK